MTDFLDQALAARLGRPLYDTINQHLADGQRAEAAIARVRELRDMWAKRTDQLKRGAELLTAALDGTPLALACLDQEPSAAGLSRADEDEAADVYEEMLRRVESSGPRPDPAATQATDSQEH